MFGNKNLNERAYLHIVSSVWKEIEQILLDDSKKVVFCVWSLEFVLVYSFLSRRSGHKLFYIS